MTYKPQYIIGPKSPGMWKELRRLEQEVLDLWKVIDAFHEEEGYTPWSVTEVMTKLEASRNA